jgi:hypothetical protein
MTEDVQLAALAVIELTAGQIVDPERTQLHRDELDENNVPILSHQRDDCPTRAG